MARNLHCTLCCFAWTTPYNPRELSMDQQEFSYNLGADHMRKRSGGLRRRRTMSSSRAEGIVTAELKARRQQPDRPIHRPTDSLLSWTKQVNLNQGSESRCLNTGASGYKGFSELGRDASLFVRRQAGTWESSHLRTQVRRFWESFLLIWPSSEWALQAGLLSCLVIPGEVFLYIIWPRQYLYILQPTSSLPCYIPTCRPQHAPAGCSWSRATGWHF